MKTYYYPGGVEVSILLGLVVIYGVQNKSWAYYETDPDWWAVRLWTKRN